MGNFNFPKVWGGAIPIGGELLPPAPMVATAMALIIRTGTYDACVLPNGFPNLPHDSAVESTGYNPST